MKITACVKAVIAIFTLAVPVLLPTASAAESLALTHVAVIDVESGTSKPNETVVVTGNLITAMGADDETVIPRGAKVINALGKFVIPGLWDMHVHWYNKQSLTLFIANGVTGIRQMFGNPDLLRWRDEIARGSLEGPRMVVASPIVDGDPPVWPGSIVVHDEAEGRKAVVETKRAGADFVKVYSRLSRDAYLGIADEARRQGIPFAGHVPQSISAAEASEAGQKSIEHLTGILLASSTEEAQLRRELEGSSTPVIANFRAEARALDTFSPTKASGLFETFVKHETWQCPTLTVLRSEAYEDDESLRKDPRLAFIPRPMQERWSGRTFNRTEQGKTLARRIFQKEVQLVGDLRHAGVPLLAGTDTGNPFCFPGFSLHDELALLVTAGLTPAEALRAATLDPAKYLGLNGMLGKIDAGEVADLVLLEGNPLEDIRNTQRIDAVIANGRLFERSSLDRMLSNGRAAAGGNTGPPVRMRSR
jgi:imidazolonepropionase-like amidohydrolase